MRARVTPWLLLLPALALLVAFTHWPALSTLIDSFFSTPKGARPGRSDQRQGRVDRRWDRER